MTDRKPYILVVRQLGGVGDVIMLSCVFRGLKEKYPEHTIKYVTAHIYLAGALTDIADHNPYIDEIIWIEPYEGCSLRTRQVWGQYYGGCPSIEDEILWQKADLAVCLNTPCVDYEWEHMHDRSVEKPRYQIWCEAAGVTPSSYAPIYRITPEEQIRAKQVFDERGWTGQRIVGVGINACDPKRGVAPAKTQQVCRGLQQAGIIPVTIDNSASIPGFQSIIGHRLRDLIPLLAQMDVVISVDSGLIHMAGAVGTPVVGLFGPTDYRMRMGNYLGSATDSRNLMSCAPCWYSFKCRKDLNPARHVECLQKITPEVIVEETLRWVDKGRKVPLTEPSVL